MITEPQFILEEDKLKIMQNYTKSDILKKNNTITLISVKRS